MGEVWGRGRRGPRGSEGMCFFWRHAAGPWSPASVSSLARFATSARFFEGMFSLNGGRLRSPDPFVCVSFPSDGVCPSSVLIADPPRSALQVVPHERLLLGRAERGANAHVVLGLRGLEGAALQARRAGLGMAPALMAPPPLPNSRSWTRWQTARVSTCAGGRPPAVPDPAKLPAQGRWSTCRAARTL